MSIETRADEAVRPHTGSGIAWIAGVGSSAGLGAAVARRFAAAGLIVALTGRNTERLRAVTAEIVGAGGQARALPGDVSSADDVRRLIADVAALGPLRVAVFNAGNAVRGTPLELSPEQFESTWRGSTYAGFVFARAAIPGLLAAGGGSLLFTGATASLRGRGPFVAFAAATRIRPSRHTRRACGDRWRNRRRETPYERSASCGGGRC